jgi:hypothetical protein
MSQIGLNNMNIIFSFIILYYSNHLRLQFELSKNSILMKQINNIYETYTEIYQISICCTSTSIITEQKVWKVEAKVFFYFAECLDSYTRQKRTMPSAVNLTLGKGVHLPSAWLKALGKHYFRNGVGTAWITWRARRARAIFAECYKHGTRQKANFTVCLRSSTRQKANLPSVKMLPSVFWITLGILPVCRVLDFWHSAKWSALSNNRVSGSAWLERPHSKCARPVLYHLIICFETLFDKWEKNVFMLVLHSLIF